MKVKYKNKNKKSPLEYWMRIRMALFGYGFIIMIIHFEYQVGLSIETVPNHAGATKGVSSNKTIHHTRREE
jgi:hypothetical protein